MNCEIFLHAIFGILYFKTRPVDETRLPRIIIQVVSSHRSPHLAEKNWCTLHRTWQTSRRSMSEPCRRSTFPGSSSLSKSLSLFSLSVRSLNTAEYFRFGLRDNEGEFIEMLRHCLPSRVCWSTHPSRCQCRACCYHFDLIGSICAADKCYILLAEMLL